MKKRLCRLVRNLFPNRHYSRLIRKAEKFYYEEGKKAKNADEMQSFKLEEQNEINMLFDEWNELKSEKMILLANKYDLTIPEREINGVLTGYWQENISGYRTLSVKGRNIIRHEYIETKKWKIEKISVIFSILLGLIGAITGLIAVILK